jgi:hypothetical protein
MDVRPAEVIAGEPFHHDSVWAWLGGVSEKHRLLISSRGNRPPVDLVRQLEGEYLRVELNSM